MDLLRSFGLFEPPTNLSDQREITLGISSHARFALLYQPPEAVAAEIQQRLPLFLDCLTHFLPVYDNIIQPSGITDIQVLEETGVLTAFVTGLDALTVYRFGTELLLTIENGLSEETVGWLRQHMRGVEAAIRAKRPTDEQREFGRQLWSSRSKAWMAALLWFVREKLEVECG
jgi:hypothetical protein